MLSVERLRNLLTYDPLSGIFTWPNGIRAGSVHSKGYRRVMVDKREYLEHRLAWFYVNGTWPKQVDHRNNVKSDNRISNLRETTSSQNNMNRKKNGRNRSGRKGVTERKRSRNWEAQIAVDGKDVYLGKFPSLEEAANAYNAAALKYHGEFARLDL